MKNVILTNAFSLQMLSLTEVQNVQITPVAIEEVKELLIKDSFTSAIGHIDTANVVGNLLSIDVPFNRVNIKLDKETVLVVAQITGGRRAEGTTELPKGFNIQFVKVTL